MAQVWTSQSAVLDERQRTVKPPVLQTAEPGTLLPGVSKANARLRKKKSAAQAQQLDEEKRRKQQQQQLKQQQQRSRQQDSHRSTASSGNHPAAPADAGASGGDEDASLSPEAKQSSITSALAQAYTIGSIKSKKDTQYAQGVRFGWLVRVRVPNLGCVGCLPLSDRRLSITDAAKARRAALDAKAKVPTPFAHLNKFRHVDGSSYCHALFKHYRTPDGRLAHYYFSDDWNELVLEPFMHSPSLQLCIDDIFSKGLAPTVPGVKFTS